MKKKLIGMILAAGAMLGAWAANVRVYVNVVPEAGWNPDRYFYAWSGTAQNFGAWPGIKVENAEVLNGETWHYMDIDATDDEFYLVFNDGESHCQTISVLIAPVKEGKRFFVRVSSEGEANAFSGRTSNYATIEYEKVQLWAGGPYWATMNIGAEIPEDYGYYFWWGDTVGYKREGNKWVASDGSSSNFAFNYNGAISGQTYNKSVSTLQSEGWIVNENGTYVLAPEHDAAQVQWGGGWRMPTYQELYDLCCNKCDWTWTTQNGVNGYVVRGRGDYASNSIFLPCAGYGYGTSLYDSGSYGYYWSSVPLSDNYYARSLNFCLGYHLMDFDDRYRYDGFSVRPVQDAPTTTSGDATVTPDVTITAGEYFKATLAELGYDVPTNGTPYNVTAYGLPAGLKLKYNAAVTKKVKKGKKTTTVVVTPAKTEWWIEGVPTAALDYATNPPYLVITTNGVAQTLPLSLGVEAQEVTELEDLALGQTLNEQFYLPGVTNGWTVSGLPAGLKYTAKLVTTTKKKGKKIISVTTNALPYSVYGKTTKVGLFTITAKKKAGAYNETLKFRVLVNPAPVDTAIFGDELTNIVTMAYVPVDWDLRGGGEDGHAGRVTLPGEGGGFIETALPVVSNVVKVAGLPKGVAFAAKDTYGYANAKRKTGKYLKQYGQTIVGKPTKPGTYVVTFTKNVTTGTGKKKKTVAKTAQILWVVEPNDVEPELDFNTEGGEIVSGSVGLKYGDLLAFSATSNATVTASGLPKGIKLVKLEEGSGRLGEAALPGFATWGFKGFTAKAGTYLVTVTATLNGQTVTQRVALKVDGLPDWAKGSFNGTLIYSKDIFAGLATMSVTAAGKISGKFQEFGTNWTFSASSYTNYNETESMYSATVTAKYAYKVKENVKGKWKNVTKYLTREFTFDIAEDRGGGSGGVVLMRDCNDEAYIRINACQNLWGRSDYKALGKRIFWTSKKKPYKEFSDFVDVEGTSCPISLKITSNGAVTATLTFNTGKTKKNKKTNKMEPVYYKPSCTTVVIQQTAADANPFRGEIILYFAPSPANNFPGCADHVTVQP